ncbi:MAG: hypothetical protein LC633_00760 [Desulfobulbaceae bacterium]|nr:hypothetical protein [Desulfobulbaceae bacterium]
METNQDRNQGTSSARPTEAGIVEEETITRATPGYPRVSWGAIVAGAFLTLATAWLMTLLGMAIGVSILDASEAAAMGTGFTIWTGLWMLLTALVAFFVGALLTARLARSADQMNGLLHGIENAGSDVTRSEARSMIEQIDADVLKTVSLHLITGDVQAAKNALAANTTLSSSDIDTIVDKSKAGVQQMVDEFQKKAEEAVEAASSYAQAALWATFVSALLALAVSIAGGWIGAAGVQRETVAINKRRVI